MSFIKRYFYLSLTFLCISGLLAGCDRSEEEARTLFNQAIVAWDQGKIEQSLDTFEELFGGYAHTQTATEAIKERSSRLDAYKAKYDPKLNLALNRSQSARRVLAIVENYFIENGNYPEDLRLVEALRGDPVGEYFHVCTYEKAYADYGFKLDCSELGAAIEKDLRKKREAIRDAQRRYMQRSNSRVSASTSPEPAVSRLTDFPKAQTTWGRTLNPSGNTPVKGFTAFYINTNNPEKVVARETVSDIAINYSGSELHAIGSQDFGAYWVGDIKLEKKQVKHIGIDQSWAKTRLLVDGYIVYEGGGDAQTWLELEPGTHRVEVEYVNNWHTTNFSLGISDKVRYFANNEIQQSLQANLLGAYEVLYVGLYESSNRDNSVVINVERHEGEVVLVLNSYSAIKWYVSNPFGVNIRAVVYGGSNPGSSVVGDIDGEMLVLPAKSSIGSYSSSRSCRCTGALFHCEGDKLAETQELLERLTGKPLTGFTGKYSAASVRTDEIKVTEGFLSDLMKKEAENERMRQACATEGDPDFETLMNR